MKRLCYLAAACFVAMAVAGAAHARDNEEKRDTIADGRAVAQENCASCHAIGMRGRSPFPEAPPFRDIGRRYRFPVLEEELIAGVGVGHPPMPKFQLSARGVDALLLYMRHIQARDRAP
jgi:cytochrome c